MSASNLVCCPLLFRDRLSSALVVASLAALNERPEEEETQETQIAIAVAERGGSSQGHDLIRACCHLNFDLYMTLFCSCSGRFLRGWIN
jgi:hypothetical protein